MDSERLTDAWQSYWRDPRPSRYRHLIGALCVEAWLRHQERQMRNPIGRSGDLGDREGINGEIRRSGVG